MPYADPGGAMREGIPRPEVWAMPRIDASASCDCSSARDAGPACRPPAPDAGERLTRTRKSCCTWMPLSHTASMKKPQRPVQATL